MTVTAVTPPDAASDPKHPDHDRWVKETTLRWEIEHAQLVGLPLSVAEAENMRLLERAEQKARETPPPARKPLSPVAAREQRMRERGVERRRPSKQRTPKGCICGRCVICKRNMRVAAIFERKRTGDPIAKALTDELGNASLAACTGVGRFKGLSKPDAKRLLLSIVDAACDRSVALMGTWR